MATALSIGLNRNAACVHGCDWRCKPDNTALRLVQRNGRAIWQALSDLGPLLQAYLRLRQFPLPRVTIGACSNLSRDRIVANNAGGAFGIVTSGHWPTPSIKRFQLGQSDTS